MCDVFIICDEACMVRRHDGCNSRSISKVCLCIKVSTWTSGAILWSYIWTTKLEHQGVIERHWGIKILNNYKHNRYYRCCHVRHEVCPFLQRLEWISSRSDMKLSDHIFHPSPKLQYISIHNSLILIAVPLNVTFPIYGWSKLVITLVVNISTSVCVCFCIIQWWPSC